VAQTAPEVTLTRIECGTAAKPTNVAERFSDTFAYKPDLALAFTFSCYLIKHGDEYMVWDTGFAPGSNPQRAEVGIVERLAEAKVKPEQVKYVGISTSTATTPASSRRSAARRCSSARATGRHQRAPAGAGRERGGFKDWMGRECPQGRGPDARQGTFSATVR